MLTSLRLNNFKSWRDTGEVELAPLTALFGSNSSGKTSLLQMLLLLKQTAESPDRSQVLNFGDERSLVELGTYQDLLFSHDLTSPFEWALRWTLPDRLVIQDPSRRKGVLFEVDDLRIATRIVWKGNGEEGLGRALVARMAYQFDSHEFWMEHTGVRKLEYDLQSDPRNFKFIRNPGRVWKLPPPAKCYGFPDQVRAYYQNAAFLSDLELEFEKLFARIFYLGPLRDYPKRQYSWAGTQPVDMGRRGERVVDAILAAREQGRYISPGPKKKRMSLDERVAQWLKNLGLIDHFEVRPITQGGKLFQVWVRRNSSAAEVLITDVGFGVSQILPVITLCYYAPEGSTLLFEQPEIHLHPSVQSGLADVFIDTMKTRNVQIILESHSEHLLRRLQRRVAEEKLDSKKAALYFCSSEKGESRLTTLNLNLLGVIENWPPDFFGKEFDEIAAMSKAALQRAKGKVQ